MRIIVFCVGKAKFIQANALLITSNVGLAIGEGPVVAGFRPILSYDRCKTSDRYPVINRPRNIIF